MTIKNAEVIRLAGQARWRESEARWVVEALEASGQSVSEFAREQGLDPQRLWRWRDRIEGATEDSSASTMSFVPVSVRSSSPPSAVVVRVSALEIEVADVASVDPKWLAGLLAAVVNDCGRMP